MVGNGGEQPSVLEKIKESVKRARLRISFLFKQLTKKAFSLLPYIMLIYCIVVSSVGILPEVFGRVPLASFLVRTHELPMSYELTGSIKVIDGCGNIVNSGVEVYIGGCYADLKSSTNLYITFPSPRTDIVYVVVRYVYDGEVFERIYQVCPDPDSNKITEEFIINV